VGYSWPAGVSYIDLCFAWGVATSRFYSERGIIWPTIETIDLASGGIFDGCVLAIDGFAVATRQPYDFEVVYKKDYRYCKGGFAIVIIAAAKSQRAAVTSEQMIVPLLLLD
jgi:hypothetical protein